MKSKINRNGAFLVLVACTIACSAHAQVLQDDFNGSAIDTSIWSISTPFSDSSMTESGGYAVFQNRGKLLSNASLPTDISITGRFEFTGSIHDDLQIVTRTDGTTSNPFAEDDQGIGFGFSMEQDAGNATDNVWIGHKGYPGTSFDLARTTYSISLNTFYDFRITDDGTNVALYIGDLTTPLPAACSSHGATGQSDSNSLLSGPPSVYGRSFLAITS